jgi:hypothetical protein
LTLKAAVPHILACGSAKAAKLPDATRWLAGLQPSALPMAGADPIQILEVLS